MPVAQSDSMVEYTDELVGGYGGRRSDLIHILQDIQERYDYLPRPALERVSERLGVSLSEVLRVATFYAAFSLKPRGEHLIAVCTGTACHVKGAPRLLDAIRRKLGLADGRETTEDGKFTVRDVRCIGCCSLAPAMTVDDKVYGNLGPEDVQGVLESY